MDASESNAEGEFRRAYERYYSEVYSFIRSRVETEDKAEDLTLEVFVSAWRAWGVYRSQSESPPGDWLKAIAEFACKNHEKRRGFGH